MDHSILFQCVYSNSLASDLYFNGLALWLTFFLFHLIVIATIIPFSFTQFINLFFIFIAFHCGRMIRCHHYCLTINEKTTTTKLPGWTDGDTYGNIGIYIEFLGKAHCHWTEGSGSKKETYNGSEIYLEERQWVLGNANGEYGPHL